MIRLDSVEGPASRRDRRVLLVFSLSEKDVNDQSLKETKYMKRLVAHLLSVKKQQKNRGKDM
jgi:hypothetical protein